MSGILYKFDFASGKSYIGITTRQLSIRVAEHAKAARYPKNRSVINHAWRKHGMPTASVLAIVDKSILLECEKRAIQCYGTLVPNGYNTMPESAMSPMHIPSVAAKVSAAMKGRPSPIKGRPFTSDHKHKISLALIGIKNWLGKTHTNETKIKMRKTARDIYTKYEFDGMRMCLQDWSDKICIKRQALHNRLSRGWSVSEAFTIPLAGRRKKC